MKQTYKAQFWRTSMVDELVETEVAIDIEEDDNELDIENKIFDELVEGNYDDIKIIETNNEGADINTTVLETYKEV